MKLSIITVNLNNVDGLKKTAESIISQTFQDFEWIVIDGGSTDGSKELIEQYSDHIAYWCSEKDSGIYNAMNKGVRCAKGEYVQFLNSGDWLTCEDILQRVSEYLHSFDIVYGDFFSTDNIHTRECSFGDQLFLHDFLFGSIGHCASFITRKLLVQNPYNESNSIVSDWEFFFSKALNNSTFYHIIEFVAYFDESGISSTNLELLSKERNEVKQRILPQIIQNELAYGKLSELICLRLNHPIFSKIITFIILLMGKIDRVFNWFSFSKK